VIDDAVLRPGRFGKKHYVPLPGAHERVSILKAHARSKPISTDVHLDALARRAECNNLTGADLASLVIFVIYHRTILLEVVQTQALVLLQFAECSIVFSLSYCYLLLCIEMGAGEFNLT
jgi:AAA+ superfamily predicted ATPase